jgi:hypothetical protein
MEKRFWPIPITKPEVEWTEFDRDYIGFMETAYSEGFRPCEGPCNSVEVGEFGEARSATLIFRGSHNGWEAWLVDGCCWIPLGPVYGLGESACVCVRPPFRSAARLVLEWMRGRSLESLLNDFEFVGGYPAGITLRVIQSDSNDV